MARCRVMKWVSPKNWKSANTGKIISVIFTKLCAFLHSCIFRIKVFTSNVKSACIQTRILSLLIIETYGCLAISLLSMALSFPESRDKTADSIVAIIINLQLIAVVDINLEPDMVSIESGILQKSSASQGVLTLHAGTKSLFWIVTDFHPAPLHLSPSKKYLKPNVFALHGHLMGGFNILQNVWYLWFSEEQEGQTRLRLLWSR